MFLTVSESVLNDTEPTQKLLKAIINNIGEISDLIPNAHNILYSIQIINYLQNPRKKSVFNKYPMWKMELNQA